MSLAFIYDKGNSFIKNYSDITKNTFVNIKDTSVNFLKTTGDTTKDLTKNSFIVIKDNSYNAIQGTSNIASKAYNGIVGYHYKETMLNSYNTIYSRKDQLIVFLEMFSLIISIILQLHTAMIL